MTYRGPAGAIDPHDPEPFDALCVRPDSYFEALLQVDDLLTACVEKLDLLTPPEPDLRHVGEVLALIRDHYFRARRTRAIQLALPFYAQTFPRV